MQGEICMMMHDTKKKITSNSNIGGFSQVVTIDTTNKGSRPEIHDKAGGGVG
jgi:hypothetical protein